MDTRMRRWRILALMHPDLVPPESLTGYDPKEINTWKTEYDVVSTLREMGHTVQPLGVQDDLMPIRSAVQSLKPHVVFNLLEEFHGEAAFDQHVVSYLELLRVPYTGCNPRGLVLARDKALTKKILTYHRVRVPRFATFRTGRKIHRPAGLSFPLIVKSLVEHASLGIAQASVVDSDAKLEDRVAFIHETIGTDAIAEEYIPGRELYVGVLGNQRLTVLPAMELLFENLPPNVPTIATARVKHDLEYQARWGIFQRPPEDLSEALEEHLRRTCKRIYRALELDGYARLDFRLRADGTLYFLEANPNPEIARSEEFASAADYAGISYPTLLRKIVAIGIRRGVRG